MKFFKAYSDAKNISIVVRGPKYTIAFSPNKEPVGVMSNSVV